MRVGSTLTTVKPFLNRTDLEKPIHAFISLRIDYLNALYVGVSQLSLSRLQLAACFKRYI